MLLFYLSFYIRIQNTYVTALTINGIKMINSQFSLKSDSHMYTYKTYVPIRSTMSECLKFVKHTSTLKWKFVTTFGAHKRTNSEIIAKLHNAALLCVKEHQNI